jgi:uncharacterized protein (DUF1810 family)
VLAVKDKSAEDIFGYPDNLKFQSCMTLFVHAAPEDTETEFHNALERFFDGRQDAQTEKRLEQARER